MQSLKQTLLVEPQAVSPLRWETSGGQRPIGSQAMLVVAWRIVEQEREQWSVIIAKTMVRAGD